MLAKFSYRIIQFHNNMAMADHENNTSTSNVQRLPGSHAPPTLRAGQLPPRYNKRPRAVIFTRHLLVRFTPWTQSIEDPDDYKRFLLSQTQAWGDLELSTTTTFAEMQASVCKELERIDVINQSPPRELELEALLARSGIPGCPTVYRAAHDGMRHPAEQIVAVSEANWLRVLRGFLNREVEILEVTLTPDERKLAGGKLVRPEYLP